MTKEYKMSHYDAESEADKMRNLVEAGEAQDYNEAEKILEKDFENLPVIENKELGVSYKEIVEELPIGLQEQTGIKRLRRRKVVSYPDYLYEDGILGFQTGRRPSNKGLLIHTYKTEAEIDSERKKFEAVWHFLTDGRFLTYKTWSHEMGNDLPGKKRAVEEFFEGESVFQEFFPKINFENRGGFNFSLKFFEKREREMVLLEQEEIDDLSPAEASNKISFFDMSVSSGENGSVHDHPTFVFGGKNKRLTEYLEDIRSSEEIKQILSLVRWVDKPFSTQEEREDVKKAGTSRNLQRVAQLINGEYVKPYYHPLLPIVRHPDIKRPFRWCDAELAILPQGKELEIVFFETE